MSKAFAMCSRVALCYLHYMPELKHVIPLAELSQSSPDKTSREVKRSPHTRVKYRSIKAKQARRDSQSMHELLNPKPRQPVYHAQQALQPELLPNLGERCPFFSYSSDFPNGFCITSSRREAKSKTSLIESASAQSVHFIVLSVLGSV